MKRGFVAGFPAILERAQGQSRLQILNREAMRGPCGEAPTSLILRRPHRNHREPGHVAMASRGTRFSRLGPCSAFQKSLETPQQNRASVNLPTIDNLSDRDACFPVDRFGLGTKKIAHALNLSVKRSRPTAKTSNAGSA